MRIRSRPLLAGLALFATLLAAAPAGASAAKTERLRFELTEFAGTSQIYTGHEIYPCTPNMEVVTDGTLSGSFASPLSNAASVRLSRSDARGKLAADAGLANYQQAGLYSGDRTPCGAEETESFETSCARPVPTVPGIVGRVIDASKKKVEIEWRPTFDGVENRLTPDFNCIPRMGSIPMATEGNFQGGCSEHRYPRRIFTGEDEFELEVICAVDFVPFFNPVGLGTYAGTYRAQLTLVPVDAD